MSDGISGVKNIKLKYPIKPVAPTQRDRESGKRKKEPPKPEGGAENVDDGKLVIDEYI